MLDTLGMMILMMIIMLQDREKGETDADDEDE